MLGLITANIQRRRARTALTAAGISVGVAAVVALLALSAGLNQTAGQLVHLGRADLGLFQKEAADPTSSVLPLSLVPRLKAQPEVADVAPIQLLVSDIRQAPGAVVLGVQPDGFVARLLVLTQGRPISPGHVDIGDGLASQVHATLGSSVRIGNRTFTVAGIYHSGITEQDSGAMITLSDDVRRPGPADIERGRGDTGAVTRLPEPAGHLRPQRGHAAGRQ
jgi:putative ABC transport system permease protein